MNATIIYTGQFGLSFNFHAGSADSFSIEEKVAFAERAFHSLNIGMQDRLKVRSMSVGDLILFEDGDYLVCLPSGWASIGREKAIDFQKVCPTQHIARLDMLQEFEKFAIIA